MLGPFTKGRVHHNGVVIADTLVSEPIPSHNVILFTAQDAHEVWIAFYHVDVDVTTVMVPVVAFTLSGWVLFLEFLKGTRLLDDIGYVTFSRARLKEVFSFLVSDLCQHLTRYKSRSRIKIRVVGKHFRLLSSRKYFFGDSG